VPSFFAIPGKLSLRTPEELLSLWPGGLCPRWPEKGNTISHRDILEHKKKGEPWATPPFETALSTSEPNLQPKLQIPHAVVGNTGGGTRQTGNFPVVTTAIDAVAGISEVRVIEQVVGIHTKFGVEPFCDREGLGQ